MSELEWNVTGDFLDLSGDGEPEMVKATSGQVLYPSFDLASRDTGGEPLRLLNRIDNGNGGVTEIRYAAHNDPSVASALQSDYVLMPSHVWVVKDVKSTDVLSGTSSVAEVRYGNPVWNPDSRGDYGFRGFKSIETSAPHEEFAANGFSVTEQTYDFELDWSGRSHKTTTYVDGFPGHTGFDLVASISEATWEEMSVLSGASASYKRTLSETRLCEDSAGNFAAESVCESGTVTTATDATYRAYCETGGTCTSEPVIAYAKLSDISSPNAGGEVSPHVVGTITDQTEYALEYETDRYELMLRRIVRLEGVGNYNTHKLQETQYYPELTGLYNARLVQMHGSYPAYTTTYTTRDLGTGNVVAIEKPEQMSRGPGKTPTGVDTEFSYSGFEVYPSQASNELGHVASIAADLGTGLALRSEGPNTLDCNGDIGPEGNATTYDGFGRPQENRKFGCATPADYQEYLVAQFSYTEFDGTNPSSIRAFSFRGFDGTDASEVESYVDGYGRVVRERVVVDQGAIDVNIVGASPRLIS